MVCVFVEKFQGGDQGRIANPKYTIDAADVSKLIPIGNVLAIPCHKKIAPMKGSNGQMESVTTRIIGHHVICNVCLHDLNNRIVYIQ